MPCCEICYTDVPRRKRSAENELLCHSCWYAVKWNTKAELLRKIKRLEQTTKTLRSRRTPLRIPSDHKYRFTSPFSAIPPLDILKNAALAVDTESTYGSFPDVLANFYGIDVPPYYHNPDQVPSGAIACYYPSRNVVYSRGGITRKTAFHEMWHALEAFGLVPKTAKSEKNADLYARGCIVRLESF